MKNHLFQIFVAVLCLAFSSLNAQTTDTNYYNYGIWQTFGDPVSRSSHPEILGRLCNFRWKELETAPGVWDWTAFDSDLAARADDGLPIIFMVYTEEDAPDWLYSNGVPKVAQRDDNGNVLAYCPYYADPTYKMYFERMISTVRHHLDSLPAYVRNQIIAVQGCFGSTGDYISYKGNVDPQYALSNDDFFSLFKEFTQYYYDQYKDTKPRIYLLSNPKNNGEEQYDWLIANLPDSWVKTGSLGKGFQLNDEISKSQWLYPIINAPQVGNYIRARSEIIGGALSSGWWNEAPYQNMFALMSYCIYWGVDWSNQGLDQIDDPLFDSAFSFYNKYAGQKDPVKSTNAMCALHDGIDASDTQRFPESVYGSATRTTTRFNSVLKPFIPYGARLEDPNTATAGEMDQLGAKGINDVGWNIFPGNYDRFLHQLDANTTSVGYWNVQSNDKNSMYGRFGRGFDIASGKDALYFDVDDAFLRNAPLKSQYPVIIDITYLDKGNGEFRLYYDGADNTDKASITVTCANSGQWKKASVTLADAYFGNRGAHASDFYIKNAGSSDVIFAVVELTRPDENSSYAGYSVPGPVDFGSICINSSSPPTSFTLSASFLTSSTTVIGPRKGFVFATSFNGPFADSLVLKNTSPSFYQSVYVKYKPSSSGAQQDQIPVTGGGVAPLYIPVTANVFDNTTLSAAVTSISCYNAKDGSIDLKETGGTGPFTFTWTSTDGFRSSTEDIINLKPSVYTVSVNGAGGCVATASYEVKQPDQLVASVSAQPIICKGGSTIAEVTATGGTLPYTGTGSFTANAGYNAFTVTDAHGCTGKTSISIDRGTLTAPSRPAAINSPLADQKGLCQGGTFDFSVDEVMAATSYTWTLPAGSRITDANYDSSSITVQFPANFTGASISVTAGNVCGTSSAIQKDLSTLPGQPGVINGPSAVLAGQQNLLYSVVPVEGLTYDWTVPTKAVITSGQNDPAATVDWGTLSGSIKVKAQNGCGSSPAASSLMVNVVSNAISVSSTALPSFDTTCINGVSTAQSFSINASGLDGSDISVEPVTGYVFSENLSGTYTTSLTLSGYGTSINKTIYVKFSPSATGYFKGNVTVNGGGAASATVKVTGTAVNSSPLLSASISNISCSGRSDGAIDLSVSGGSGPFYYEWSGSGLSGNSSQDLTQLAAGSYTVSVTSYAGCKTTAYYTVKQPEQLAVSLSANNITCNGGTTTVHVSALGGTLPYQGVGDYSDVSAGTSDYTVTDANGCAATGTINLVNGNQGAPWKPGYISSASDAQGVCGGGDFSFTAASVANAGSYSWTIPAETNIVSANADSSTLTLHIPQGFLADSISVRAINSCGASDATAKNIVAIPSAPTSITGPVFVNEGDKDIVFSVEAVNGVSYLWTVPSGVIVISGQNSPSITVNWGKASGTVAVRAMNDCGTSSSAASLKVQVVHPGTFNVSTDTLPAFGPTCVNSTSAVANFTVTASGLNGTDIVIGNAQSFLVATQATGPYADSLVLSNYGSGINQIVYVKYNPSIEGGNSDQVDISGGGIAPVAVQVSGTAVKNNLSLHGTVTNITCNGLKNGAIAVSVDGTSNALTFNWSGPADFYSSNENIQRLAPGEYTVSAGDYTGCSASETFNVSQPEPLRLSLNADQLSCTSGTTTVHVSASGGSLPYTGTGSYAGIAPGWAAYIVTDANGCSATDSVAIANTAAAPTKPATINNNSGKGLCGGGNFEFSVDPVEYATAYNWIPPSGSTLTDISPDGTTVTLSVPADFTSGTLSVTAANSCGTSEAAVVTLSANPPNPGRINGPTAVNPGQQGVSFSVAAAPGVTYEWQVPAGATLRSGQYSNSITVDWGTSSGNIQVTAVNACATSATSSLMVIAGEAPDIRPLPGGDDAKASSLLVVTPNPVRETAVLRYTTSAPGTFTLQLYTLSGKLLLQRSGPAIAGVNRLSFDVTPYTNGLYLVTLITDKGERKTAKLLKQ